MKTDFDWATAVVECDEGIRMKSIGSAKAFLVVAVGWELETRERHYNGNTSLQYEGIQILRGGHGRES